MTAPLPAVMDVLDRADALTRDQLLAHVQVLGTDHPPAVLEAAVDAHLAQVHSVPPVTSYQFGWHRPRTTKKHQQHLKRWRWVDRTMTADPNITRDFLHALLIAPLIVGGLALFDGLTAATLIGPVIALGVAIVTRFVHSGVLSPRRPLSKPLTYATEVYLTCPPARAYLQAVLTGPCPTLMEGDQIRLDRLVEYAHRAAKVDREAQEQAQRLAHQMATLNQAIRPPSS